MLALAFAQIVAADATTADAAKNGAAEIRSDAVAVAGDRPSPSLGFVGQRILASSLAALCTSVETRSVLAQTCKLSSDAVTLGALRSAVILDVLRAVTKRSRLADRTAGAAAVLALALERVPLRAWIARVPDVLPRAEPTSDRATALLTRMQDIRPLRERGAEDYLEAAQAVAREQSKQRDLVLSQEASALTRALAAALQSFDRDLQTDKSRGEAIAGFGVVVSRAWALAEELGRPTERSAADLSHLAGELQATRDVVDCADKGDAAALYDLVVPILDRPDLQITPPQKRALAISSRLAMAESDRDVRNVARDALLPLPAWVDRVILDVNAMPPEIKRTQGTLTVSINSDLTVGYNGERGGFFFHGDTGYYQLAAQNNFSLTERYDGAAEIWGLVALGRHVRADGRLALGGAYYGTLADNAIGGGDRQTNQDSIFLRGSGLLGARAEWSRVSFGLWAGGGAQYEDYFSVVQTSNGTQATAMTHGVGARFDGRARLQWTIVPSIVTFRARADVDRFSTRRDDQAVTFNIGRLTQNQRGVVEVAQTEVFARAFLDLDALRFFGFVPAAHGGVNVFALSNGAQGVSSVVPVVGAGLRREAL